MGGGKTTSTTNCRPPPSPHFYRELYKHYLIQQILMIAIITIKFQKYILVVVSLSVSKEKFFHFDIVQFYILPCLLRFCYAGFLWALSSLPKGVLI